MKKIINTLKNGSKAARRVIVLAVLAMLATVGFAVSAILFKQLLLFFGAVIGAFVAISLFQTLQVYEYEQTIKGKINTSSDIGSVHDVSNLYVAGSEEERLDQIKEAPPGLGRLDEIKQREPEPELGKLDELAQSKTPPEPVWYDEVLEEVEEVAEIEEELPETEPESHGEGKRAKRQKKEKTKKEKGKKEKTKKEKTKEKKIKKEKIKKADLTKEDLAKEEAELEKSQEETGQKQYLPASDEEIESYNKKKIKKTLHRYKVKRDHRLAMIDFCDKYSVFQTPSYIWVEDRELHILLIEQEPRQLILPLSSIKGISYLKKKEAIEDTDYPAFHKKTLLTEMFRPYLPDYTHSTVVTDLTSYKNLYGIGPGIYFTNRSAKNLFDLLGVEFQVDDKVTMSTKVNVFFKDAYKASILLRDNVLDANGYADRISSVLDNMVKSSISYNEFKETLNLMMKNKLITQEFAMYYMEKRDKNR